MSAVWAGALPARYLYSDPANEEGRGPHCATPEVILDCSLTVVTNRARINSVEGELVDNEHVVIHLKDRSKPLSEDEREWYERAFGKKRNLMNFEARFVPLTQSQWQKGSQDIYIHIKYRMYPEMYDEFNARLYDEFRDVKIKMNAEEDDNENYFYKF
jgi:hypothetical protein